MLRLPPRHRRPRAHPETAARALVTTWIAPMIVLPWPQRLELLEEIDRLLIADLGDLSGRWTSREFTAQLLERLAPGPIASREQADFYLNSARHEHSGLAWRILNGLWPGRAVDMPAWLGGQSARLFHLSATGARAEAVAASGRSELSIADLEPLPAWVDAVDGIEVRITFLR
ncbi:MAG: hypothetical protein ACM33T_17635 [Solirubrobacterales bacterium]